MYINCCEKSDKADTIETYCAFWKKNLSPHQAFSPSTPKENLKK